MTADQPRPIPVTAASSQAGLAAARVRLGGPVQVWDIGDTEPRDVETRVEWGVRRWPDLEPMHCASEYAAKAVAETDNTYRAPETPRATLVSRTVHVDPWETVQSAESRGSR